MVLAQTARLIFPFILCFSLIACGSGGFSASDSANSNTAANANDTDSGDNKDKDDNSTTPELRFGSKENSIFSSGTLLLSKQKLSAGGSTSIKAWVIDPEGLPYPAKMSAEIISECIASGLARVEKQPEYTTGIITANYIAQGCRGQDDLTMKVSYEGKTFVGTAKLEIEAPVIGSVRYDSTTIEHIGIKGLGLGEVSTLKFQVLDDNGNAVIGEEVRFKPNTIIGGVRVLPELAITDNKGFVSVDVHSGTVSTSVKVTAEVVSAPLFSTQSRNLVISTGIADQDSISISAERFNPESFNYDGEVVSINILAADHFNNPVPDGTTVFFTTEGGQIEPQCSTENGGCSVKWKSSAPRPADGRITILASLLGEESFIDSNGNGLLDDTEVYDDIGVVFRDDNEDGVFNGSDERRDSTSNHVQVASDNEYNGILCSKGNTVNKCSSNKNIFVNASIVLVMSTSVAKFQVADTVQVSETSGTTFPVLIADQHEQPMPEGTTVEFSIGGDVVKPLDPNNIYAHKLISEASRKIDNTNVRGFTRFLVTVSDDFPEKVDSFLKIKVTTPKGTVSEKVVFLQDRSEQLIVIGEAADPANILFDSAEPSYIGISGFGLNEVSQVRFRVVDEEGKVVKRHKVNFSLSTSLGGATIKPTSATTDDNGYVLTTVHSGTLATTIKVVAEVEGFSDIATQSRGLVISTGVADQNSVSLSADILNPEAWHRDGAEVNLTMYASDHFNNPVPDGTAVNFTAEGGQVDSSCLIQSGHCSVKWRSTKPYPADHRVTILATILGEESFADRNGNGVLDDGEKFFDTPEVFRDDNENNIFDPFDEVNGIYEESRDHNQNGLYDSLNDKYDGVLCSKTATICSDIKNIYASDEVVLVLSDTRSPLIITSSEEKIVFDATSDTRELDFFVSDSFDHPLPAGTEVSFTTSGRFYVDGGYLSKSIVPSTNIKAGTEYHVVVRDFHHGSYFSGVYNGAVSINIKTPAGIQVRKNILLEGYFAPRAIDDLASTTKNQPVQIEAAANDHFKGDIANGDVAIVGIGGVYSGAIVTVNAGVITYTPATDYVGTDYFWYKLADASGRSLGHTATVNVTVVDEAAPAP